MKLKLFATLTLMAFAVNTEAASVSVNDLTVPVGTTTVQVPVLISSNDPNETIGAMDLSFSAGSAGDATTILNSGMEFSGSVWETGNFFGVAGTPGVHSVRTAAAMLNPLGVDPNGTLVTYTLDISGLPIGDYELNPNFGGNTTSVSNQGVPLNLTFQAGILTLIEDTDGDGVGDVFDNCPNVPNPLVAYQPGDSFPLPPPHGDCALALGLVNAQGFWQPDFDCDGVGDACDNCPNDPNPLVAYQPGDSDGDCALALGLVNAEGLWQPDFDCDGVGDVCDGCPEDPNKIEPGACGCGVPEQDPCPADPSEPSDPDAPDQPDQPADPDAPAQPDQPADPDAPAQPDQPADPDAPDETDQTADTPACGAPLCGMNAVPTLAVTVAGLLFMKRRRDGSRQTISRPYSASAAQRSQ